MAIPKTGAPVNGRTFEITLTPKGGSGTAISLNCYQEVAVAPAMNSPSVEIEPFQGGDSVSVTADGGYQNLTYTCEYSKENYDLIDTARANVDTWSATLGADGFTGEAIVTVSEGPTLPVNGKRVRTMTVQLDFLNTKAPTVGA